MPPLFEWLQQENPNCSVTVDTLITIWWLRSNTLVFDRALYFVGDIGSPGTPIAQQVCCMPSYVFVLCCSRSGSTLLRFALDSHPRVWCPPEAHLGGLAKHLRRALRVLSSGAGDRVAVAKEADVQARRILDEMISPHHLCEGRDVFCDKSVTSVDCIPAIKALFPEAKFVCLYRHCMDVVHSALERCRFGWDGFGFLDYIRANPANLVDALIDYWADKTSVILQTEESSPGTAFRVTYESLVFSPNETLKSLFEFLGLEADDRMVDRIFSTEHQRGPGDHKIWFTDSIQTSSVGKGLRLSPLLISKPRLQRMNGLLARLGYAAVGEGSTDVQIVDEDVRSQTEDQSDVASSQTNASSLTAN